MSNEPLAKLLDGAVLGPLCFPLGEVLAEAIRDVGPNECLVATKAERRGDLFEILDDVIGEAEGDQGHGFEIHRLGTTAYRNRKLQA